MSVKTPVMGWDSRRAFGKNVSEEVILASADALVSSGLRDCGYEYVLISDGWACAERNDGVLAPDPEKFPHGMEYIAGQLHSRGLKLGLYIGSGSLGNEFADAQTLSDWSVDLVQIDLQSVPEDVRRAEYCSKMSMALTAVGAEAVLCCCDGDVSSTAAAREAGAEMIHTSADFADTLESFSGVAVSRMDSLGTALPGCFNDLGSLTVAMKKEEGTGDVCSKESRKLEFAWWSMFASPLMIGGDIRELSDDAKEILCNREIIAVDQDPEARPAFLAGGYRGERMAFFRHLDNGEYALLLVNLNIFNQKIRADFSDVGLSDNSGYGFDVYDLYEHENVGSFRESFISTVPMKGCKMYRLRLTGRV